MNKPAAFGLLALVLGFNLGCEQQSYEETKMFNQSHTANGSHEGKEHEGKAEAGKPGETGKKETKE